MTRTVLEPHQKLARQVERSTDLSAMFRLVDALPGDGIDALLRLIRFRYRTHQQTVAFDAGRGAPCDSEGVARPSVDPADRGTDPNA